MSNKENNIDDTYLEKNKKEVSENYKYFKSILTHDILSEHYGEYALLKNKRVIGYFNTLKDVTQAASIIEDGLYSIQKVENTPTNLGYFSHAVL